MSYIVKSSLDISSTIIPWNERENAELIKEKKEYLERMKKRQENLEKQNKEESELEVITKEDIGLKNEEKIINDVKSTKRTEIKKDNSVNEKRIKGGEE